MCGDIDDETDADEALRQRLRALAGQRVGPTVAPGVIDLDSAAARASYMQARFASLIAALSADLDGCGRGQAADMAGAQSVILARLAGIMAAELGPQNDPLRPVLEALLFGYDEQRQAGKAHHHHGHDHDHDHDHDH